MVSGLFLIKNFTIILKTNLHHSSISVVFKVVLYIDYFSLEIIFLLLSQFFE